MNKFFKYFFIILIAFVILFSFNISSVYCGQFISGDLQQEMGKQDIGFRDKSGYEGSYSSGAIGNIIATIIKAFLGLLGIIFLIIIIIAGQKWMTAGGNEDKIADAKAMLSRAIIGLIIIVAAYAITEFVFKALPWGGSGGPGFTS